MLRDSQPVMFSAQAARLIATATNRTLGGERKVTVRPRRQYQPEPTFCERAIVTVPIPGGSIEHPSNAGRVKILDGTPLEEAEELQVLNDHAFTTDVPEDAAVKIAWIRGQWWLIAADPNC